MNIFIAPLGCQKQQLVIKVNKIMGYIKKRSG